MKKQISILLSITLLISLVFTACSKQNETTLTGISTDVYGKVVSIDGSKISVDVVAMPNMAMGNNQGTPSEMPSGDNQGNPPEMPSGNNQGTPPEMPSGDNQGNPPEMPSGDNQGTPPEKPTGESGDSQFANTSGNYQSAPEMMTENGNQDTSKIDSNDENNETTESETQSGTITVNDTSVLYKSENNEEISASLSDITVGDYLKITFDENSMITKILICDESVMQNGGGNGVPGGQSSAPTEYEAVNEYNGDTTINNKELSSTGTDENAILVSGGAVTLDNVTVTRNSSDSTGGDNASFYGVGAAILATDGTLTVSNSKIITDSAGGAGIFAYGSSVITVKDSTIATTQNTSGGIHVAGGGTLHATNLDVVTNGASAAAIRSDRGGGTMTVNGGSYTSNGTGSPAIYCTADISVKDAALTATNSEAICIEGKNNLKLYNCELTGNMPDQDGNDSTWTVIVYQSMSGDSEIGSGSFQMVGGKLVSKNGGLFYTTNTTSHILLNNVTIDKADDCEYLLACLGNNNTRGWGTVGKNGAECTFTAISQDLEGEVLWDSVSKLNFYLTEKSVLNGSFVQDESYAGDGGDGCANLYIDNGSKWIVNGNSVVTNLYNAGQIVDSNGKTVSIVGADGTKYVEGTGSFTVTVSSYSTTADFSGADAPVAESQVEFN